MPDPSAPITWGIIGSLATACAGLGALVVKGWPIFRRAEQFFADWQGEPARPGVEAKPGVMVRLASLESGQEETTKQVTLLAVAETQRAAAVEDHERRLALLENPTD